MRKTYTASKFLFQNGRRRSLASLSAGLNYDETKLLEAASLGDVVTVQKLLDQGVKASIKDSLDRTPLLGAVAKNNQQMIEILTPKCDTLDFYEALMSAIRQGKAAIACYLVNSPRYDECMAEVRKRIATGHEVLRNKNDHKSRRPLQNGMNSKLGSRKDAYSVTLATNASPIVLAAQMNLFEVVKTLLDKGERIEMPDNASATATGMDPYYVAKTRLETYRGLTSEAYVSLANTDPIRTAMELGQSLRQNANIERYFSEEYNELADALSSYLVKLMDHVRNTRELDTIINHTVDGTEDKFATLKVAVDYGEMKVRKLQFKVNINLKLRCTRNATFLGNHAYGMGMR
ncbi:short transient receptor potential channel 6-like [Tubulanus polymorphus]|uniref:short transient receptor potential channel 6-like n=1 Tax=Tubulanus polymorphus TaxID=672921 RepID=UPI003DA53FD9